MLRQAVYSLLLLGLAQGLPAAAQSAENFSVEGSSASDPTVQLVDLTGVDPDDYDEESLTPALIEKLHEQAQILSNRLVDKNIRVLNDKNLMMQANQDISVKVQTDIPLLRDLIHDCGRSQSAEVSI